MFNVMFRREPLFSMPVPVTPMRCRCYAHSQLLLRNNEPVDMTPAARVRHPLPPLLRERYRHGYDAIAACWIDGSLPEARRLERVVHSAWRFYAGNEELDWQRLRNGWRTLGLAARQTVIEAPLFPLLRLINPVGMLSALTMSKPWVRPLNQFRPQRRSNG